MKRFEIEVDFVTKIVDQRVYRVDALNKNEAKKFIEDNIDSLQFESATSLKSEKMDVKAKKIKKYNQETETFEEDV
jgi:polyhydroxyalkanoate synthesis regulator phasin